MKRAYISVILITWAICAAGQNWGDIRSDKSTYLSVESSAETKVQAIKKADKGLARLIEEEYSKQFKLTADEQKSLDDSSEAERTEYARKKIESYNLPNNFHTLEIQDEPQTIIGKYISRKEIEDVFGKRKVEIDRYVSEAMSAEKERNLSVALRYYYWSYMLLKTMRTPSSETYSDRMGNTYTLLNWLPEKISTICESIEAKVTEIDGNRVTLGFKYEGQDISSLDFRCKIGSNWSMPYSAKDGMGEVDLPEGYSEKELRIKYEYKYEEESEHLDEEVYDIFSFIAGNTQIRNNINSIQLTASESSYQPTAKPTAKEQSHLTELTDAEKQKYENTIEAVVKAIQKHETYGIEKHFTSDGYDVFQKLIEYGSAKVKSYNGLSYTRLGNDVIVRSIPMSFSFKNGSVRSFIEDVVFTINASGKISNISFGLGKEATAAIMARDKWGDTIQQQVINFLEVYKTAYALKRYEYLQTLFADNAVIIVGRVAMQASKYPDADRYGAHKIVVKTRYTKAKYMEHLKKCFDSNEFINIRFARTTVTKKNKEQIFGIQLKQYYNSTTYGDEGYLYLQVDMRNPSEPVIMVRTWQEDYDPEVGRPYGMQDF